MTTYTDYKPLNARVDVDFVKKKVHFGYPKGSDKIKYIKRMIKATVYGYSSIIWLALFVCYIIIVESNISDDILTIFLLSSYYAISVLIFYFIDKFIINHIFINYPKYSKSFPKWNYALISLFKRPKVVLIRNIKSKTFEIPYFSNIIVEYKAKGDYAKYLKHIHVREYEFEEIKKKYKKYIIEPNMYEWKIIFTLKKVPKNGYMIIKYM